MQQEALKMKNMQDYQITQQALAEEITLALKDLFVAQVTNEDNQIILKMLNGQTFKCTVQEVLEKAE